MEEVLDVYQKPYDNKRVLICMDEGSRQLVADVVEPLPPKRGAPRRVDDKYERRGVRSLFMFYNPVAGWRRVGCRDSRTRRDFAEEVKILIDDDYPDAEEVTLVCDNLNTHDFASLYFQFDAETAGRLRRKLRLAYTPKNGSWLNMAEMELSILSRQCIGRRRFADAARIDTQIAAWQNNRNRLRRGTIWRLTTEDARIKLASLYPPPDTDR